VKEIIHYILAINGILFAINSFILWFLIGHIKTRLSLTIVEPKSHSEKFGLYKIYEKLDRCMKTERDAIIPRIEKQITLLSWVVLLPTSITLIDVVSSFKIPLLRSSPFIFWCTLGNIYTSLRFWPEGIIGSGKTMICDYNLPEKYVWTKEQISEFYYRILRTASGCLVTIRAHVLKMYKVTKSIGGRIITWFVNIVRHLLNIILGKGRVSKK